MAEDGNFPVSIFVLNVRKVNLNAQNILKHQQTHFVFMNVILLHSGHQHVSATQGGENKNTYCTYMFLNV